MDSLSRALSSSATGPDRLLAAFCTVVDDEDLREIAAADWGMDYEANLEALRLIAAYQMLPSPFEFEVREVCELTRWDELHRLSPTSPGYRTRHVRRGFACAVLLRWAMTDDGGESSGENQTIAPLVDDVLRLGPPFVAAARGFLAWMAMGDMDESERPFAALGALLCWRMDPDAAGDGEGLRNLAEAIVVEESVRRSGPSAHWLLDLTLFNARHRMWKSLAEEVLLRPKTPHPAAAREVLYWIGAALCKWPD